MTGRDQRPRSAAGPPAAYAEFDEFRPLGLRACVTTRLAGDLGLSGAGPVADVLARWNALRAHMGCSGPGTRFATSIQVHGVRVLVHGTDWEGWTRADDADGHIAPERGTGLGITVADCVPVFLGHPSGAAGLVHAGWRGTAGGILGKAIQIFRGRGLSAADLHVYLGPAICGDCYEVGPDVYAQITGRRPDGPRQVDLRGVLADQARVAGIHHIAVSAACTRCDNETYFSHRAGDAERQVAALASAV